jgi:hypothetical protein
MVRRDADADAFVDPVRPPDERHPERESEHDEAPDHDTVGLEHAQPRGGANRHPDNGSFLNRGHAWGAAFQPVHSGGTLRS